MIGKKEINFIPYYCKKWDFTVKYPSDWEIVWENEPAGSWDIAVAIAGKDEGAGRPAFMVNVRDGEILEGNNNITVWSMRPDGERIKIPSTPKEYIEIEKTRLPEEFPEFQFVSGEEMQLINKPAAKMVYSYKREMGKIMEESITLFGDKLSFQFISEIPFNQYSGLKECLNKIIASFQMGKEQNRFWQKEW